MWGQSGFLTQHGGSRPCFFKYRPTLPYFPTKTFLQSVRHTRTPATTHTRTRAHARTHARTPATTLATTSPPPPPLSAIKQLVWSLQGKRRVPSCETTSRWQGAVPRVRSRRVQRCLGQSPWPITFLFSIPAPACAVCQPRIESVIKKLTPPFHLCLVPTGKCALRPV